MASLYKRASPSQQRILRAVEGAVKNVADAHGLEFNSRHARSIAKRATGTLTSQWGEVLAAKSPSKKSAKVHLVQTAQQTGAQPLMRRASYATKAQSGGMSQLSEGILLLPLLKIEKDIRRQMWRIKNTKDEELTNAFVGILRMISALKVNRK